MKIQVLKSEGTAEPYLHTKVLGTFHNALASVHEYDLTVAEQMAEAITFYLYRADHASTISSDQIHLLIQSVLTATGYGHAADALNAYRMQRKLQRRRMVVVRQSDKESDELEYTPWTKAKIVDDLVGTKAMDQLTARAIAGAVEEKVIKMGVLRVRSSLIRELVLEDTDAILRAERQLQAAL
jgi:hypothetical protein